MINRKGLKVGCADGGDVGIVPPADPENNSLGPEPSDKGRRCRLQVLVMAEPK